MIPRRRRARRSCGRRSGRTGALWMPVFHVFSPLMTQSSPSRSACVSMNVASEPCCGLGDAEGEARGGPRPGRRSTRPSAASVPYWIISSSPTLLPTIECSFCRSQCSPRPLAARCSRITAMPRFVPSWPPYSLGERVAVVAGRVGAPARLARAAPPTPSFGRPPRSQSVRASSRRWSKKRMLSSCCSSGLISRSMKSSSSAR